MLLVAPVLFGGFPYPLLAIVAQKFGRNFVKSAILWFGRTSEEAREAKAAAMRRRREQREQSGGNPDAPTTWAQLRRLLFFLLLVAFLLVANFLLHFAKLAVNVWLIVRSITTDANFVNEWSALVTGSTRLLIMCSHP